MTERPGDCFSLWHVASSRSATRYSTSTPVGASIIFEDCS